MIGVSDIEAYIHELRADCEKYATIAYGEGPAKGMVDSVRWGEFSSQCGLLTNLETFIKTGKKRSVIAHPPGTSVDW